MVFDPHPDANLVSALIEGSLNDAARRDLLRHLSGCDDCRRWIACAQLASPDLRPAAAPAFSAHTAWGIRAWRWELPLAAVAGLALAGGWWLRTPQRAVPAPARLALAALPATPFASGARRAVPRLAVHRLASAAPEIRRPPALRPEPAAAAPTVLAALTTAPLPLPAVSVPPPNPTIQPSIDFAPLMTGFLDQVTPATASRSEVAWNAAPPAPPPPAAATAATLASSGAYLPIGPAAAVPASFDNGFASTSAGAPVVISGQLAPSLVTGLGWAISRGGQVFRSIGTDMWAAVPFVPGVHVHALSSADARIWAAGRADQLYLSLDHGAHWHQVKLPNVGAKPAPVASIVFTGTQRGQVNAADGRSWTTADGGATWTEATAAKKK